MITSYSLKNQCVKTIDYCLELALLVLILKIIYCISNEHQTNTRASIQLNVTANA